MLSASLQPALCDPIVQVHAGREGVPSDTSGVASSADRYEGSSSRRACLAAKVASLRPARRGFERTDAVIWSSGGRAPRTILLVRGRADSSSACVRGDASERMRPTDDDAADQLLGFLTYHGTTHRGYPLCQ